MKEILNLTGRATTLDQADLGVFDPEDLEGLAALLNPQVGGTCGLAVNPSATPDFLDARASNIVMGFVFPTVVARMRETVGRLAESGAGMSDCDFANACEPRAFAGGLQVWVGQDAPLYMTERIVRELRQLNVEPVFAMYGEDSSVLGFIPAIGG